MCFPISPDKDWIDVLSALLTPTVAIFGTIIAVQQGSINEKRYRHELFDRRYEIYKNITTFLANIISAGTVSWKETSNFLVSTRTAIFVFDKSISDYVKEIYEKANRLELLETLLKDLPVGQQRNVNLEKQEEIKSWISGQMTDIESKFERFLGLDYSGG